MKLLVSDYDGTVNFHGEVHKEDVEALSSFKKEGNIISIASSRPFKSLHAEVLENNIPGFVMAPPVEVNALVSNTGNVHQIATTVIEVKRNPLSCFLLGLVLYRSTSQVAPSVASNTIATKHTSELQLQNGNRLQPLCDNCLA